MSKNSSSVVALSEGGSLHQSNKLIRDESSVAKALEDKADTFRIELNCNHCIIFRY